VATKAQTLKSLYGKLKNAHICETFIFTVNEWNNSQEDIISGIQSKFTNSNLIIRSSALNEDGLNESMAGAFDSVKNINSKDNAKLISGIDHVIKSYGDNCNPDNEILIQSMVSDVSMSGVVFTHELNFGSPYYVINYDDISGLTDTVTAGDGEYANRTIYINRNALNTIRSKRFVQLIVAIQEIEQIMNSKFLDIEFAIDKNIAIYILQVRAITTIPNWNRSIANHVDSALKGIQAFVKRKFLPINGIYGNTTVFGQMPDWNPAEMIGRVPHVLAYSLYEKLITDHAWRIARKTMNYAVPEGQPLMVSLAGQPFIDTRLSFHSYLPEDLDPNISNKLVNVWVQKLKDSPELHDKIEFDIAITTYSFDIDNKIKNLVGDAISEPEKRILKKTFLDQTTALLSDQHQGSISKAILKINLLAEKQQIQKNSENSLDINQLFLLIDECIHLGTIPFSILARHGFIAKTLLLSLVQCGILSMDEVNQILASIRTVASDLVDDMDRLQTNEISRNEFMAQYGHLRPGSYDIMSSRYDQMPDFVYTGLQTSQKKKISKFGLTLSQKKSIDNLLNSEGFTGMNCEGFLDYVRQATSGREYGKFIFTRSLSNILEIVAKYGEDHFLTRDELSHIPINDFLSIVKDSSEDNIEDRLRKISELNKEKNIISSAVRLPQILFDEAGVFIVPFQVSHPNFITSKKITAKCVIIVSDMSPPSLNGKIVLIQNADPGFDWIFSQQISGLITKYGGANSHMAIRCAEFGIPAAIGCGEQRYNAFLDAKKIMLDCSSSLIKMLK
jgi:phosphohistidine swiveling domain-containing protein